MRTAICPTCQAINPASGFMSDGNCFACYSKIQDKRKRDAGIIDVTVCAIPYTMQIVDGGVLFSEKSGFYGVSSRVMCSYRSGLWYVETAESTFGGVAMCHLIRMYELLKENIGGNHEIENVEKALRAKRFQ